MKSRRHASRVARSQHSLHTCHDLISCASGVMLFAALATAYVRPAPPPHGAPRHATATAQFQMPELPDLSKLFPPPAAPADDKTAKVQFMVTNQMRELCFANTVIIHSHMAFSS